MESSEGLKIHAAVWELSQVIGWRVCVLAAMVAW